MLSRRRHELLPVLSSLPDDRAHTGVSESSPAKAVGRYDDMLAQVHFIAARLLDFCRQGANLRVSMVTCALAGATVVSSSPAS